MALLYLLRHGDAEDGDGENAPRRLTEKGRGQAEAAGSALRAMGAEVDACLTSPRARAEETARLACAPLGVEPEVAEELSGGRFDGPGLAAGRGDTLLVGHEPDFSDEVARLTGANAQMKKCGLAIVEGGTLLALLRPKELAAIAAGGKSQILRP
jgi:phosphohistidine phosphatase SixA